MLGGILGSAPRGITITNCYNTANITMNPPSNLTNPASVGGILGNGTATNYNVVIENCYNIGTINANRFGSVGGIVGELRNCKSSTVMKCYNTGEIYAKSYVGGIVGCGDEAQIQECYNVGNINGTSYVGGIAGKQEDGEISNCYNFVYIERINTKTAKGAISGCLYGRSSSNYAKITECKYYNSDSTNVLPYGYAPYSEISVSNNVACTDINEMIIDFINENSENFVEDTEGINDGYPILVWQVE